MLPGAEKHPLVQLFPSGVTRTGCPALPWDILVEVIEVREGQH
jgi:hypothetical protein